MAPSHATDAARRSKESRAEIRFPVTRVGQALRVAAGPRMRLSADAAVFAAAVVEGLVATILYRVHKDQGKSHARITPAMIAASIRGGDGALSSLLDKVDVSGAAVGGGTHALVGVAPIRRSKAKSKAKAKPKAKGGITKKRRSTKSK